MQGIFQYLTLLRSLVCKAVGERRIPEITKLRKYRVVATGIYT